MSAAQRGSHERQGGVPRRCTVATVVWGQHYRALFADLVLPNLLSRENLPALAQSFDCTYRVLTRSGDIAWLERHASIGRLQAIMPVRFVDIDRYDTSAPTAAQSAIFRDLLRTAAADDEALCYCMPDAVWTDGSLREIARSFEAGHVAIQKPSIRVVAETVIPELERRIGSDGNLHLSHDEVGRLGLEHLHPLTACYAREVGRYPHHAELILTAHERTLGLTYHFRDPKVLVPTGVVLNDRMLVDGKIPTKRIDSVADSRILGLSLTPLLQDVGWYRHAGPFRYEDAARSWLDFDTRHNDATARQLISITTGSPTGERRQAHARIRHRAVLLTVARAAVALIRVLPSHGCSVAARLLAGALHWLPAHRLPFMRSAVAVIVPTDAALGAEAGAVLDLLRPDRAAELAAYLRAHVISLETAKDSARPAPGAPADDRGEVIRGVRLFVASATLASPHRSADASRQAH